MNTDILKQLPAMMHFDYIDFKIGIRNFAIAECGSKGCFLAALAAFAAPVNLDAVVLANTPLQNAHTN